MTIAFVSLMNVFPWGGSEELWFKTAKLALAQGHTVHTLTQQWPTLHAKINELKNLGAKTEFYYKSNYSISDKALIKLGIKERIDEVFSITTADAYIVSNGTTFDFMYHSLIINYILKTAKPCIMISQHGFENGNILNTEQRVDAIRIVEKLNRFFYVSERNLTSSERQMAYRVEKASIISNPLNVKEKSIVPFPVGDALLMACVARLECSFKGQDILLQALSHEQWRDRDFKLSFYGAGPDSSHIQKLIQMYNLRDKVEIKGHVSNVNEIWKSNQVLVMSSLSEGTSLSLVEAMLLGRAALSTNIGDHNKYVIEGETGFLAETASVDCLNTTLERLWSNKDKLQRMGEKASQHAIAITDLNPEATLLDYICSQSL